MSKLIGVLNIGTAGAETTMTNFLLDFGDGRPGSRIEIDNWSDLDVAFGATCNVSITAAVDADPANPPDPSVIDTATPAASPQTPSAGGVVPANETRSFNVCAATRLKFSCLRTGAASILRFAIRLYE